MDWVNAVIQGILTGGLYALFATGLSLAFGVMRFVNLAHGDLAILAAYLTLSTSAVVGVGYWPSMVIVVVVMFVVGYVGQRGLFNFTLGEDPLPGILVSFGVGIVIQNALQEHYTATDRSIDLGPILTKSVTITDDITHRPVPPAHARRGRRGARSRCSCSSRARRSAGPSGPRPTTRRPRSSWASTTSASTAWRWPSPSPRWPWPASSAGPRTSFSPSSGGGILLFAFEAVVIGGLGSLWGTLVGGIVLGVAQGVGNQASIGWDLLAGHLVFLFVLLVRPRGLMGGGRT